MEQVPPLKPLPPLHDSSNHEKHHVKHSKKPHHDKHKAKAKHHNSAHHGHKKSPHQKKHHKKHHKAKENHKPTQPQAPQRRLSTSFQPVSWSDFAAVEQRLTAEALQFVNDPKRVEHLRLEAMEAAKEHLESTSVWTLEEDKELLRGRGFEIQQEYDDILNAIQKLPSKKHRTIESLKKRETLLLGIVGTDSAAINVDTYVQSTNAMQNEAAHLLFRGQLVILDVQSDFLNKGTGYALSQGVREENLTGVPMKLSRNKSAKDEVNENISSSTKSTKSKKNMKDLLKAPSIPNKDLSIVVKSNGGGSGQTVPCSSTAISKMSPLLKASMDHKDGIVSRLLETHEIKMSKHESDRCVQFEMRDGNKKTIVMTGNSAEMMENETYTHEMICKSTVTRLARFSIDPKMIERADYLSNATSRRLEHTLKLRTKANEQVLLEQTKIKTELRTHQEQEKDELREYLEEQMKAEIDAVVARHEQIKIAEHLHLAQRQNDQIQLVDSFFNEENRLAKQMGNPPKEEASVQLQRQQQINHVEEAIRTVFNGSDVMLLMLLGSYLHSNDLVAGCIRSLTQHRPDQSSNQIDTETKKLNKRAPPLLDYLDGPGSMHKIFTSTLIDDSILVRLTQKLSTRALMALEANTNTHNTSERLLVRVRRELKSRKIMTKDDYQKLTHVQLRELKNQSEYFVENLTKTNGSFFQDELFTGSSGGSGGSGGSETGDTNQSGSIDATNKIGDQFVLRSTNESNARHIVCDWSSPPFVDLVEEELQRRRKISNVCFNPETLPNTLSLSYDRMKVTLETANRYATAQATVARSSGEFGKWMFEIEILKLPTLGCTVSIGFDVPLKSMSWKPKVLNNTGQPASPRGKIECQGQIGGRGVSLPGHSRDEAGRCGYAWEGDGRGRPKPGSPSKAHARNGGGGGSSSSNTGFGAFHVAGRTFTAPETFCEGDTIGVTLDQDHDVPRIVFYRNGRKSRLGTECEKYLRELARANAWKEKRKHVDIGSRLSSDDIPIVNFDYKLVPAICLYSANQLYSRDVKPCVRANYKGPFKYPVHSSGIEFAPFGGAT